MAEFSGIECDGCKAEYRNPGLFTEVRINPTFGRGSTSADEQEAKNRPSVRWLICEKCRQIFAEAFDKAFRSARGK